MFLLNDLYLDDSDILILLNRALNDTKREIHQKFNVKQETEFQTVKTLS